MGSSNGKQFGNKYILLDLIGTGGMAEVYKCKLQGRQGFEKLIVLKKLLPHAAQDSEIVTNFINEARLAALLQHENIAQVYDFGESKGSYFIAMEYLFGKDLHNITIRARETNSPIGPENSLLIALKICEAMEYAHSLKDFQNHPLNIIHRDLSPHNIFITFDGKVKIIDFGIARAELRDTRTKVGVVKGKISYMSPEQLTGREIDHRSDIFSIGILLYEMLSGKRMYSGDTATLIRKCMQVEYDALEEITPDLPAPIYSILRKALAKDRRRRYQSCTPMIADISECLFSIIEKPNTQKLKHYIRDLFQDEYNRENNSPVQENENHEKTQVETIISDEYSQPDGTEKTEILTKPQEYKEQNDTAANDNRFPFYFSTQGKILTAVILLFISTFVMFRSAGDDKVLIAPPPPRPPEKASRIHISPLPEETIAREKKEAARKTAINDLLKKAGQAYGLKRLTKPKNDSAYTYFKKVLELDPENHEAHDGIHEIGRQYHEFAKLELLADNFEKATGFVQTGLMIIPEDRDLLAMKIQIKEKKNRLLAELEMQAVDALERNRLSTPEGDCAYKYYSDILRIDKDNPRALQGLRTISDRYAARAEKALLNLNMKKARYYIRQGLLITPNHKLLLELQDDLKRSKPGIFFKSLRKDLETILK
ncbi:protein kinase domain-containing protein [Desulfomarina sp.]